MTVKKSVFLIAALATFIAMNWFLYDAETIKTKGNTLFLELSMYSRGNLDYAQFHPNRPFFKDLPLGRGYAIFHKDARGVGFIDRVDQENTAREGEYGIPYEKHIIGEYQEGDAVLKPLVDTAFSLPKKFSCDAENQEACLAAKYAAFRVERNGRHLLVGLADKHLNMLQGAF